MEEFRHACRETLLATALSAVVSLFATSLFAVFVRAYAPSELTVAIVDRAILLTGVFFGALLFIGRRRALFKGAAAGAFSLLLTSLIFGVIGGFHFTALFLADLLLCAVFGAFGALAGVKIRKEQ